MRSVTTACDRALALAVVIATAACEVATGGAFASTGVTFGASVGGDAEESTSTASADDGVGKTDDGPDEPPKPGIDDETTGIDDDASTETSTSAAESSTGAAESESESEGESGAPAIEPWSSCLGGGCGEGMVCLAPPMQAGLCTQPCLPAGDPTSCAAAPDGLDTTCISLDGASWCAIECGFAECPAGTDCIVVADDFGAAQICL